MRWPCGCPRCGPTATSCSRPRPALAHRAGHAWEQLALPLAARRADAPLLPRQPRAARLAAQRGRDPRRRRARPARVVRPHLRRLAAPRAARARAPRAARAHRLAVRARTRSSERLGVPEDSVAVVPNGVSDALLARRRPRAGPRRPRPRPPLRARARHPQRAQERRRARRGGRRAPADRASSWSRRAAAAATCAAARPARARARLRARAAPARPLRRGARAGDALALRGLRPALPRGDGVRDARGGRRPRGAARDLRRRRAARGPADGRGVRRRRCCARRPTRPSGRA